MQPNLAEIKIQNLVLYLKGLLPNFTASYSVANDMLFIETSPSRLLELLKFLKCDSDCLFTMLTDLSAVDYPERTKRFELIYNLLSLKYNLRVIVKTSVVDQELVPSIHHLYSAAIWYEREVWDMYGVGFESNPDLRRILTDYGFSGHPQRKDFPLTGYVEVRYDELTKKVIYEPVKLNQEFRNFDFLSPWEGPDYLPTNNPLAGDENSGK